MTKLSRSIHAFKKQSETEEQLVERILTQVAEMAAIGLSRDTITYNLVTEVGPSVLGGFQKLLFMSMIENALDKLNVR